MAAPLATHSRNAAGVRDDLVTHLRSVAKFAAALRQAFGGREVSSYASFIGKAPEPFQKYLAAKGFDIAVADTRDDWGEEAAAAIREEAAAAIRKETQTKAACVKSDLRQRSDIEAWWLA
jgi:hypothetical protein